jgi:hypothetical protein
MPHTEPQNDTQEIPNVYVPSLLKKANQGIRDHLNNISFKNSKKPKKQPHEFSIKLDPETFNITEQYGEGSIVSMQHPEFKNYTTPAVTTLLKQHTPL